MTDALFSAVSRAIYSHFGDKYTIYTESVQQGLSEPCFFIRCLKSSLSRQLGNNFLRENLFCIQFFPRNKLRPSSECHAAANSLMLCLEYVSLDGQLLRGSKMNYEIHDGVLNFFINFNFFAVMDKSIKSPKMERLDKIILKL